MNARNRLSPVERAALEFIRTINFDRILEEVAAADLVDPEGELVPSLRSCDEFNALIDLLGAVLAQQSKTEGGVK